ncbi:MAG: insulinase family protein [Lachnospiraceae bacterium]|nr:insulinase family protein [Lachnospiraceae bacterium]
MIRKLDINRSAKEGELELMTDNRVPVYSYANPHLHSFCLCLYLRAGSLFESDDENGISHFFEHMVFKNINRKYGGKLFELLDRLGLEFNGCTYKEFMQFEITGACVHFKEAAEILTSIFEPFTLPAEDIATERRRIKSELRESDELHSLDHFTQQIVWEGTSLKNTIGGTFSNLDHMGKQALRRAGEKLLSVNNLFFYVTGCYSEEDIAFLMDCIDSYPLRETVPVRNNLAPVPDAFFRRNCRVAVKNSTYYYVRFSFDVDTERYTEAENSLLYDIMFEGESCKIHQELSEKTGMIYSFGSQYERYNNLGNLSVYYEVRPGDFYTSMERVIRVCRTMKYSLTDELAYVLPPYVDNAELMLDDADDFNWNRAYECHILEEPYRTVEDRKEAYQKVTVQRIMEMSGEIFRTSNLVVTMKAPKGKVDEDRIRLICSRLDEPSGCPGEAECISSAVSGQSGSEQTGSS